ncbi:MAG: SDR family NAD(P)-dependent oxidoreductase [Thermoanaerobaculia bacterium]
MNALADQIYLVTGASSGIGAAIARALAAQGARLVLCGRDRARLAGVAEELRGVSPEVDVQSADLEDEAALRRLAARVLGTFGGVDGLVHSAAAFTRGPVAELPVAELDAQFRLNLRAPYLLTQLLLPSILARRGQIVFVNSTTGKVTRAGVSAYAASKFGLRAFADCLREEVAREGVRVLSIYPGRTATPMQELVCRLEGIPYLPEKLLQAPDVAALVVAALALPRSAEVTEIDVRQSLA